MTKLDQIEHALRCAISLLNTLGGNVGGGKDIYAEALRLIAEMKADCVVVPRETSNSMIEAGCYANVGPVSTRPIYIWNAMIQAAESEQKGEK